MAKKALIFIFVIVLIMPLIASAPPTQTNVNLDNGLSIVYPKYDYIVNGLPFNLTLHIYNISDGTIVNNATCELDVYNKTGAHLISDAPFSNTTNEEHYYFLAAGNLSVDGAYRYDIYCEKENVGGFADGTFSVNSVGEELTTPKSIIYVGSFAVFMFLFLVNIFSFGFLPSGDKKDEDGNLLSIGNLKYLRGVLFISAYFILMVLLFLVSNISEAFLQTTLLSKITLNLYLAMGFLAIPLFLVWFIWIFYSIFKDKEMKNMMERGIPVQGKP